MQTYARSARSSPSSTARSCTTTAPSLGVITAEDKTETQEDTKMKFRLSILAAAMAGALALPALAHNDRDDDHGKPKGKRSEALRLKTGRSLTMDASNPVVEAVRTENGRIIATGRNLDESGRVKVIDLRGKTVIPGIIDAHSHIVLVGNRPGWHT